MKVKLSIFAYIIIFGTITSSGQNLPVIQPSVGSPNNFTKGDEENWRKAEQLIDNINSGDMQYDQLAEQDRKMVDSLEAGFGPMTQGAGCSWYCGGGPYKITSSDYLQENNKITYLAENVHDFNLLTAWVPNTASGTIGKKVNFYFKPFTPRVTEISIWNGYIKTTDLWTANARVAKLKLYINGVPTAILALEDVTNTQTFKINPIQSTDSSKDLIFTMEITEIYKGTRYNDVAISEINFNGLDVHCFAKGTLITMADYSIKPIESVIAGDSILTYYTDSNEYTGAAVSSLITAMHCNLATLHFSDRDITATMDHPFLRCDNIWVSADPDKSNSAYLQENTIQQLSPGDQIMLSETNKFCTLISIEPVSSEQSTYSLSLMYGNSFIANGMIVKTENVLILPEE